MFTFGFKKVNEEEKQNLVSGVFNSVATKYDLMNNIMSCGMQKIWKNNFCDLITLKDGGKYLDLAGGNGDITHLILEKAKKENKNIEIIVSDASEEMLTLSKKRFAECSNVQFSLNFAEDLPFEDKEFDAVFVSFGIRNFTNINKSLLEIHKILKKNGSLFCLEFFSDVSKIGFFDKIYKQYLLKGIPNIGKFITKDKASYQYFGESILNFYSKQEFINLLIQEKFILQSRIDGFLSIVSFLHFKK
jgi:demethylmenaquinone methyltransferase / 2-methoxy-6-polyprenyl-1,4-benzoquinol methylase